MAHSLLTRAVLALGVVAPLMTAVGAESAPAPAAAKAATPDYRSVTVEIDIAKPATEVWAKVGKYCDIQEWLKFECKVVSGNGEMGTVRALAGGRVLEIMTAKSDLSYGYSQPVVEGRFYNQYHGYMEAKPVSANSSKMIYTVMLDLSDKADEAAKTADLARRKTQFEGALKEMKRIAEAP